MVALLHSYRFASTICFVCFFFLLLFFQLGGWILVWSSARPKTRETFVPTIYAYQHHQFSNVILSGALFCNFTGKLKIILYCCQGILFSFFVFYYYYFFSFFLPFYSSFYLPKNRDAFPCVYNQWLRLCLFGVSSEFTLALQSVLENDATRDNKYSMADEESFCMIHKLMIGNF